MNVKKAKSEIDRVEKILHLEGKVGSYFYAKGFLECWDKMGSIVRFIENIQITTAPHAGINPYQKIRDNAKSALAIIKEIEGESDAENGKKYNER